MTLPKRIAFIIGLIGLSPIFIHSQKTPYFDLSKFSVYTIEEQVFRLLNEERESRGLSPLETLPELVTLARNHSQDMARQGRLTHDSSDGKTYSDRLVEAGLYFLGNGENGAFSKTFSSRLIHQSLLSSPEHRENILNPNFDQVGIGVFYQKDKGFFVTQDFLRSFPKMTAKEFKQHIIALMNKERKRRNLPLLYFSPELEELAAEFTQRKTEGLDSEKIPDHLGYTKLFTCRTPNIDEIEEDIKRIVRDKFTGAGLEVIFSRSEKNIGGEYLVALLLTGEDKRAAMSAENLREQILVRINRIRKKQARKELTLDTSLCQQAEVIASHLRINPHVRIAMAPRMRSDQLVMFSTNDPFGFSASTEERIGSSRFHTVGIGIVIDPNPDTPEKKYWITLIFD